MSRLLTPTGGAPREALVVTLATRLDETTEWENALDEPDRMRLGVARLLLARPDVALIADVARVSSVQTESFERIKMLEKQ